MVLMANRYILPAALEYQKQRRPERGGREGGRRHRACRARSCSATYTKLVDQFKAQTDALAGLLDDHNGAAAEKHAKYMRDKVVPAMAKLREIGDEIEVLTPHELWPLPTYGEMLFVK